MSKQENPFAAHDRIAETAVVAKKCICLSTECLRTMFFSPSLMALCALISLNGHGLCHLRPLPAAVGTGASVQLSPGLSVHA